MVSRFLYLEYVRRRAGVAAMGYFYSEAHRSAVSRPACRIAASIVLASNEGQLVVMLICLATGASSVMVKVSVSSLVSRVSCAICPAVNV